MPLDSIRADGAFVRAHGRHAVKFSRRSRALGRHRGASESAVSTRCSGGPRHLDTPLLAPPRGAPIVHAGRLGTVRANYCMYSHSLRHVSASDGPIRHPKRHRSTHAGLRDSLAAHRPPTRRSTSTQALARASPGPARPDLGYRSPPRASSAPLPRAPGCPRFIRCRCTPCTDTEVGAQRPHPLPRCVSECYTFSAPYTEVPSTCPHRHLGYSRDVHTGGARE